MDNVSGSATDRSADGRRAANPFNVSRVRKDLRRRVSPLSSSGKPHRPGVELRPPNRRWAPALTLILATYLGQAGLRVLAVDRAPVAGGGLATLEDPRHPGLLHNTHAFFQRAITAMPWYADLELERHGARYI